MLGLKVQRWQWRAGATMQDPRTIGHSQTKEVESGPATHHRVGLATKLRQVELRPWKPAFFWETNRQISPFRQNTGGEEERSASVQWPMDSTPEKAFCGTGRGTTCGTSCNLFATEAQTCIGHGLGECVYSAIPRFPCSMLG